MNAKQFKNKVVAVAAMFAIVLGVGAAIAMKAPDKPHKAKFTTSWFTYNGSGSVTDPANYTKVSGDPSCPGTTNMCSIQAAVNPNNSKPVITTSLQNEINTALSTQTPTSNVHLQD